MLFPALNRDSRLSCIVWCHHFQKHQHLWFISTTRLSARCLSSFQHNNCFKRSTLIHFNSSTLSEQLHSFSTTIFKWIDTLLHVQLCIALHCIVESIEIYTANKLKQCVCENTWNSSCFDLQSDKVKHSQISTAMHTQYLRNFSGHLRKQCWSEIHFINKMITVWLDLWNERHDESFKRNTVEFNELSHWRQNDERIVDGVEKEKLNQQMNKIESGCNHSTSYDAL